MTQNTTHAEFVRTWAAGRDFTPVDIDCITAVMLKILDGKCKMSEPGMRTMALLYDCVKSRSGSELGDMEHALIEEATTMDPDDGTAEGENDGSADELRMRIYERRVLAEMVISRPVMKAFKAMLRAEGVIGDGVAI